jgi:site-specific DNA recombinase
MQELEKHGVTLEAATETVDNSEVGKLVFYIKGYAAKLEAEKIRERTMRGRRTRALDKRKLPGGSHSRLYGYVYIRGKGEGQGIRCINEDEAKWVREMYHWLIDERLSTHSIASRLTKLGIPTPTGRTPWNASTVQGIFKNLSYCGKTYAFTCTRSGLKPKEEWIEIPGVTPPIINEQAFNEAQECLRSNRIISKRNIKNQYLLAKRVYCARCGRMYLAQSSGRTRKGKEYNYPYYYCPGRRGELETHKCDNIPYRARQLESNVWEKIQEMLSKPEVVIQELERAEAEDQSSLWQRDLDAVNHSLAHWEKQKTHFWRAFGYSGDEQRFRDSLTRADQEIESLQFKRQQLEKQISKSREFNANIMNIREACRLVSQRMGKLTFEDKCLTLVALNIKIIVDGPTIRIQRSLPMPVERVEPTTVR